MRVFFVHPIMLTTLTKTGINLVFCIEWKSREKSSASGGLSRRMMQSRVLNKVRTAGCDWSPFFNGVSLLTLKRACFLLTSRVIISLIMKTFCWVNVAAILLHNSATFCLLKKMHIWSYTWGSFGRKENDILPNVYRRSPKWVIEQCIHGGSIKFCYCTGHLFSWCARLEKEKRIKVWNIDG